MWVAAVALNVAALCSPRSPAGASAGAAALAAAVPSPVPVVAAVLAVLGTIVLRAVGVQQRRAVWAVFDIRSIDYFDFST